MAKLVVFGASGGTGRAIVDGALAAGHTVTAFARDPATANLPAAVRVVTGDILDPAAVAAAIAGQDVVLSAIGHRRTAPRNPFSRDTSPPDLFTRAITHVIEGMRRHGVRRLLICGVHGCGDSRARTSFIYRNLLERSTIRIALADSNVMEELVAASGLDWLIARPTTLSDGKPTGKPRVREDRIGSFAMIDRADVAAFLLAHVDGPLPALRTPSLSA